jgi:hypothetical protein
MLHSQRTEERPNHCGKSFQKREAAGAGHCYARANMGRTLGIRACVTLFGYGAAGMILKLGARRVLTAWDVSGGTYHVGVRFIWICLTRVWGMQGKVDVMRW